VHCDYLPTAPEPCLWKRILPEPGFLVLASPECLAQLTALGHYHFRRLHSVPQSPQYTLENVFCQIALTIDNAGFLISHVF
jgi:hypothetical protein